VVNVQEKGETWQHKEYEEVLKKAVRELEPLSLKDFENGFEQGSLNAVLELAHKGYHQLPGVPGCSFQHDYWGGIEYLGGIGPPPV
jgi:hypothetical protein